MTRIAYLVHDLGDAAVARRVVMLRAAGAELRVAGFRRGASAPTEVAGAEAVDLGRTADAALAQRARAVARHLARPAAVAACVAGAEVIVARNLESLALAARVRRRGQRLVYECLDIHRTLTGSSLPSRAIQSVERRLLRGVDLVIVSSPAFVTNHFADLRAPVMLVENKLLALGGEPERCAAPAGPPWTIGWFGMLRCRRTLTTLIEIARAGQGRIEVLIAGKPSAAEFDDFAGQVSAAPHCRYVGPYAPDELGALYGQCHFAWAIDWFEEGLNSRWLLPNRLYEASAFGAVPIALREVETGRWLARHEAGLLLGEGDGAAAVAERLTGLDADGYEAMRAAVDAIPRGALIADEGDCRALLDAVAGHAR